ncbi:MAG: hypothetical protein WCP62_09820 [Planctomycetota bacterium]
MPQNQGQGGDPHDQAQSGKTCQELIGAHRKSSMPVSVQSQHARGAQHGYPGQPSPVVQDIFSIPLVFHTPNTL